LPTEVDPRHMTPEERERFRSRVRERWDFNPAGGAATSL
jgi:hypothetical protein